MPSSDTQFKKGHKHSPEALEKMRLANVGKKHTPEARKNMSDAQKRMGKKPPSALGLKRTQETKKKISEYRTGRPRPEIQGEKCYNWKGGITPINAVIRTSLEYKNWRKSVFERDDYSCVQCGIRFIKGITGKVELHADHIKPFAKFPELRLDINNGRTLCKPCHLLTDTYAGRTNKL